MERRLLTLGLGGLALLIGVSAVYLGTAAGSDPKPVEFADARLIVEINATDGDAGLQIFLDGTAMKTSSGADRVTSRIPSTPMRCVLQSETSLTSTYPAASAVANVQLDYLRYWKYTG